ncbi:hypothetical protein QBC44DRAFT_306202 [Cladorrhinum sp. PSN332]|nr:hypothetical protein QBC44DRAFT_306202 [Cladorrhinum sp. PSN332]
MTRRLNSSTMGLLEVQDRLFILRPGLTSRVSRVRYLHRTVKDWITAASIWTDICSEWPAGFDVMLEAFQATISMLTSHHPWIFPGYGQNDAMSLGPHRISRTTYFHRRKECLYYAGKTQDLQHNEARLLYLLDVFNNIACILWRMNPHINQHKCWLRPWYQMKVEHDGTTDHYNWFHEYMTGSISRQDSPVAWIKMSCKYGIIQHFRLELSGLASDVREKYWFQFLIDVMNGKNHLGDVAEIYKPNGDEWVHGWVMTGGEEQGPKDELDTERRIEMVMFLLQLQPDATRNFSKIEYSLKNVLDLETIARPKPGEPDIPSQRERLRDRLHYWTSLSRVLEEFVVSRRHEVKNRNVSITSGEESYGSETPIINDEPKTVGEMEMSDSTALQELEAGDAAVDAALNPHSRAQKSASAESLFDEPAPDSQTSG